MVNTSLAIFAIHEIVDEKCQRHYYPLAQAKGNQKLSFYIHNIYFRVTGAQISEILTTVAKYINIYDPDVFDMVAKTDFLRIQEFTTDQLRKVLEAFDTVNGHFIMQSMLHPIGTVM